MNSSGTPSTWNDRGSRNITTTPHNQIRRLSHPTVTMTNDDELRLQQQEINLEKSSSSSSSSLLVVTKKQTAVPVSTKLPLPVSIELCNVFSPCHQVPDSNRNRWYRPDHSTSLLHAIRMTISVTGNSSWNEDRDATNQLNGWDILYSAVSHRRTICPSWFHLTDVLQHKDLTVQSYENMRASFQIVTENDHESEIKTLDNHLNQSTTTTTTTPTNWICHVDLHPSKMYKISDPPPYHNLPLNCVVVRFTDNTFRVQFSHYQLLSHHQRYGYTNNQQIQAMAAGMKNLQLEQNDEDMHHRFEDKSFRVLDQVTTVSQKQVPDTNRIVSNESKSMLDMSNNEALARTIPRDMENIGNSSQSCDAIPNEHSNPQDVEYINKERDALIDILKKEQMALELEKDAVYHCGESILEMVQEIQNKHQLTTEIQCAIHAEQINIRQTEFLLEANRIRLIRELSFIYPITTGPATTTDIRRRYLIRGLEIPVDLFAGHVPEEEFAAALGMLGHTVHLLSKYLGTHIRYQLHCHASRTTIQDELGSIYPLFPGRAVDREKLEYAFHLLDRNVDCLCAARGIPLALPNHVVAKVKRIYEHVIDGY